MIMMGEKKKILAQILGDDPRDSKDDSGVSVDALETLAQELMDAVSQGDVKGAASALRACFSECGASSASIDSSGSTPEGV